MRVVFDPSVTFHKQQLKFKGAVRPAGWGFLAMVALVVALTVHSGLVNAANELGDWHDARVKVPPDAPFLSNNVYLSPEMDDHATRAIKLYRFASSISSGGIGLLNTWQSSIDLKISRLLIVKQDFSAAEALMRQAIARNGPTDALSTELMWTLYGQNRGQEALEFADEALLQTEDVSAALDTYVQFCGLLADTNRIVTMCRARLERFPNHLKTMRWLSLVLVQNGELEEGIALIRKTIEIDDKNPNAYRVLAMALADTGKMDEAIIEMGNALKPAPRDYQLHSLMADLLETVGRPDEANVHHDFIRQLDAENAAKVNSISIDEGEVRDLQTPAAQDWTTG